MSLETASFEAPMVFFALLAFVVVEVVAAGAVVVLDVRRFVETETEDAVDLVEVEFFEPICEVGGGREREEDFLSTSASSKSKSSSHPAMPSSLGFVSSTPRPRLLPRLI